MITLFRRKTMKNILKIFIEDKLIVILIIALIFFSECGIPSIINFATNYRESLHGLTNNNHPYVFTAYNILEWVIILLLILYLLKILSLAKKGPFKNTLILQLNKVVYAFMLLTILSVIKDTLICADTGVTIFLLPMSGTTYILLIFAMLTYMVRYICKKSIEIKDYQDLTI
ncbi:hypothetical protein HMPREF3183_01719 [Peptostreptococcus anaerobius]|uniref:DUF2975 domain-containing protein n=2 Tax=Peptostreptococcus anaerobius TaxID=1261 RepID=A0A135YMG8_9FIRM|nr:hypothetical protein HMPREF3183_01719 [Peptostreptococcus anaerobius]KXI10599.1 hypothetical protein HMPREF3195_01719 [Peptostreptococcus anaerobius]